MNEIPFVSVIIVNYNGAIYLPACLDALQNQTYPRDRYEIIVSDNSSSDGSLELLERDYPQVKVLRNGNNLGFAGGNNVAMEQAKGVYHLLINNDTAADPEWIEKMVQAAQNNEKAGIITGHLHLFYDQLSLQIKCESFTPINDDRELGAQIIEVESGVFRGVVQYLSGFYGWETDASGRKYRWSSAEAELGIPVPGEPTSTEVSIKISAPRPNESPVHCRIMHGDCLLDEFSLQGDEILERRIQIPASIHLNARRVEQNAGSIVFQNGYGRDRGTYVKNNEVFFEEDRGQYSQLEEVFAGCGANFLIKRQLVEQIGDFDDSFFMYYEDVDLCWRARLAGWKVLFAPQALVRHIHCGTTVEWSSNFFFLTERNRVAMVLKNGSSRQILRMCFSFLKSLLSPAIRASLGWLRRKPGWRQQASLFTTQLKVFATLLSWLPALWKKRIAIQKQRAISFNEIESWQCQQT